MLGGLGITVGFRVFECLRPCHTKAYHFIYHFPYHFIYHKVNRRIDHLAYHSIHRSYTHMAQLPVIAAIFTYMRLNHQSIELHAHS